MTTRCLLLLAATSGIALAGCLPVTGNRILGRDLAFADSRFSKLPATLAIGFPPAPGTKRTYATLELQRLARANGIPVADYEDICFELPMVRLTAQDAIAAMRRSLPPEAALKIVELANFDVPAGLLEFPLEGLEPPVPSGHGVQLWRGHVKYAETRQASFWARVEVSVKFTVVVAAQNLAPDTPIDADSLRMEIRTGPLEREKPATRIEDVQGRVLRRALQAGSIVPLAILAEAPAVRRGDPVTVEVQSGPARLRFQAIAESAARDGDMVELRNLIQRKDVQSQAGPRRQSDRSHHGGAKTMTRVTRLLLTAVLLSGFAQAAAPDPKKLKKPPEVSPLDKYLKSASTGSTEEAAAPGAIWSASSRLDDLARDLRANRVDDVVTIVVLETINAAATGASTTERASSANAAITALLGPKSATGALANLLNQSSDQKLNGTGTTTRSTTLTAGLSARVVRVLPGGLLYIEGSKDLQVNSEQQAITVRGIIRTADITTTNTVGSTQIADMEIRLNGKGVVADAIRRPNFLYRLLLGLLPF